LVDSPPPGALPCDVLLLPQGLLAVLLSRPARLRGRRAARRPLPGRDGLSARPPEPPPLSLLHHVPLPPLPVERRGPCRELRRVLRGRPRHAGDPRQHDRTDAL